MRASEILRGLADLIDSAQSGQVSTPTVIVQQAGQGAPLSAVTSTNQEPESNDSSGVFVPPLQAKLELLKKAVDVDNIYDSEDEITQMKKMAGINPVVTDEAASDEPLDV